MLQSIYDIGRSLLLVIVSLFLSLIILRFIMYVLDFSSLYQLRVNCDDQIVDARFGSFVVVFDIAVADRE